MQTWSLVGAQIQTLPWHQVAVQAIHINMAPGSSMASGRGMEHGHQYALGSNTSLG